MPEFLLLPDCTKLVDGTVVTIDAYESTRWVVHYGWHSYLNKYYKGWYFSSIPDQQIQPENTVDLSTIHVVSNVIDSTGLQYPLNPESIDPDSEDHDEEVDQRYTYRLEDGSIVVLRDDPEHKWILKYGWYNFDLKQYQGWYFISIADGTIRPANPKDIDNIVPIGTVEGISHRPHSIHQPISEDPSSDSDEFIPTWWQPWPGPPGPWPGPHNPLFPPVASDPELTPYQVRAAFVSVQTLEDRDKLNDGKLPDGKLVRVNNVDGHTEYYAWLVSLHDWVDVNFVFEERRIIAGDGIKGGGTLGDDVTLYHDDTGTGDEHEYHVGSDGVRLIDGILVDRFGHTIGISERDIQQEIRDVIAEDDTVAKISQLARWTVIDSDNDSE